MHLPRIAFALPVHRCFVALKTFFENRHFHSQKSKMPLPMRSKFSTKKAKPRKTKVPPQYTNSSLKSGKRNANNEVEPGGTIELKLGSIKSRFSASGIWVHELEGADDQDIIDLKRQNEKLKMKNNALQVKNEILLGLVTSKNNAILKMETELKQLQSIVSKSQLRFASDA